MNFFSNLFAAPASPVVPSATVAGAPALSAIPDIAFAGSDPFPALIDGVIGREGRYSNNPNDSGGETIWGITIGSARSFGYSGLMTTMSREQAVEIYRQRYWLQPHFDKLYAYDTAIATRLLDIGVNAGPSTGVKYLQRALNVLGDQGKYFDHIGADGGLGQLTFTALSSYIDARGAMGRKVLLGMIVSQQSVFYIECSENRVQDEDFEYGWQSQRALVLV